MKNSNEEMDYKIPDLKLGVMIKDEEIIVGSTSVGAA